VSHYRWASLVDLLSGVWVVERVTLSLGEKYL